MFGRSNLLSTSWQHGEPCAWSLNDSREMAALGSGRWARLGGQWPVSPWGSAPAAGHLWADRTDPTDRGQLLPGWVQTVALWSGQQEQCALGAGSPWLFRWDTAET